MKTTAFFALFVAAAWVGFAPRSGAAELKIDETIVGPANAGGIYAVSPRGAHVAYVSTQGSRLVVKFDGVDGPLCDELFNPNGASYFSPPQLTVMSAGSGGLNANSSVPVIFSADGAHYAYIGRQGNEYFVVHDGKEIGRGPRSWLALNYGSLTISPRGNFVYWGEMQPLGQGATGNWRLVINGKPSPWGSHVGWEPVFSADDTRYAFTLTSLTEKEKRSLIVNGKTVGYVGYNPVFTADSKVLLTTGPGNTLLVDGKPAGAAGLGVENITVAPVGSRFAAIMKKKMVNAPGVGILVLDGKEVPGTAGAKSISFSPDGKRYALSCSNAEARSAFMVIDGKKGNEYQSVAEAKNVAWTRDSAKVIYTAVSGGRQFVVVEGEEFAVPGLNMQGDSPVVLPAKGNRYAFSTYDGSNRIFSVMVDGKQVLPPGLWPHGASVAFSADGSRYAFVVNPVGRNEIAGIFLDGALRNDLVVGAFNAAGANALNVAGENLLKSPYFQFSQDGKYFARMGRRPDNTSAGLYLNETLTFATPYQVSRFAFSSDGRHLSWMAHEKRPDRAPFYYVAYVDGEPAVTLNNDAFQRVPGSWEVGADGGLTFIGVVGNDVKRFRVTPASDVTIETTIERSVAKQAVLVAASVAAKKKAEGDAVAATAKAEAERAAAVVKAKTEAEAVAAQRRAESAAAAAAKAKARADALAAKAAARQKN